MTIEEAIGQFNLFVGELVTMNKQLAEQNRKYFEKYGPLEAPKKAAVDGAVDAKPRRVRRTRSESAGTS